MKITVFEAGKWEASGFRKLERANEIALVGEPLRAAKAHAYADAEVISPFVYSDVSRPVLEQLPVLKLIATRSTGYDHVDVGYCRRRGITVCNVPSYGENTVAEHVFALLLAISRHLVEAVERARTERFSPEGLQGFDLAGKTLGVIGTGKIGQHVIRIARGFAMQVVAYDLVPDARLMNELGFRYVSFEHLLEISDVISIHVPATEKTRNMLSEDAFSRMKDGTVLINTARGNVIEPHALIMALRSGKLAAAGLDVLPDEPLIREEAELICAIYEGRRDLRNLVADHVLLRMPNVIVTPHSAFNTREAVQRIVDTTVLNIEAFLAGRPQNVVTGPTPA